MNEDQLRDLLKSLSWINISELERILGFPDKTLTKFKNSRTYKDKEGAVKVCGLKDKYRLPLIDWLEKTLKS